MERYNALFYYLLILLAVWPDILSAQPHKTLSSYNSSGPVVTATGSITLTNGFYVPAGSPFHAYISQAPAAVCLPLAPALSQDQNYIVTYTPREPFAATEDLSSKSTCQVMQSVQYFDGLGRLIQTVQTKGSPLADKDMVLPAEYDAFGREAKKYLPYASASNNGSYKPDALQTGAGVFSFYNPSGGSAPELPGGIARTPVPYAETRFEPSPLNRVEEKGAPGTEWQPGSGHTVRTGYYTNDAEDLTSGSRHWARQYGVTIDGSGNKTLINEGSYGKNQLYVTELKDENWKETDGRGGTTQEYKDKEGRIVLKRIWKDDSTLQSTYYVYDDFGNLCYVLPPKAEPDGGLPTASVLNELCYQYRYDGRKRMSAKKLPGKDWESIVYNKLDQVVATQDGEQRQRNEWLVTKYDGLGRVVMTGLWQSSISPADLQTQVYNNPQWDSKDYSKLYGYQLWSYPASLSTVLTVNYYDDYNLPELPEVYQRTDHSQKAHSLLTISRTAVLNNPTHMLWSVNYYDDKGRVTKNISQHYKGGIPAEGNYDETDNTYSFTGELISSIRSHKVNGEEQLRIVTEHEYDHMGRLVNSWKTTGVGARTLLAQNVYNEIGQLQEKRLHSADQGTNFLQKQEYAYNELGWLKRINDPASVTSDRAFGMQLSYNEHSDAQKRQYNGNISSTRWQTRVPSGLGLVQEQQGYDYSYDKLSRLELAAYTTAGKAGHFNEQLSYDKGGNILTLSRTGNGSLIDQLDYDYENSDQSNRLQSVTDGSGSDEGQPSGTASYTYDSNGNLRTDSRKGLSIEYNYLNLPKKVTKVSTNETITYLYDAAGRKLRKEGTGGNRDYIGGIEYGNSGQIEFIQTEEGRAVNTGSDYSYEYMLKDYLGNTRAVVKQDGSILQTPDYYAFGLELNRNRLTPSPDNRYKYNGKELQTELGLGQYDYGARFYDAVIGRWSSIDPMSELYRSESPFVYGGNCPLRFMDIGGLFKIEASFVREYPTLAKMLKYYLPMLKDNPIVREAFTKVTGLGNKEYDEIVTYGKGPWVTPTRPELGNWTNQGNIAFGYDNEFDGDSYPNNIFIAQERLRSLEKAFKSHDASELGFRMFWVSLAIMHEATHYGVFKNYGPKLSKRMEVQMERGALFEKLAFRQFSYLGGNGAMNVDDVRNYYTNSLSEVGRIGMTLSPRQWFNNFIFKGSDEKIKPLPEGDPHIHE